MPNGNGGFNVDGTNTYAADGTYSIKVTLADLGGSTGSVNSTDAAMMAPQ